MTEELYTRVADPLDRATQLEEAERTFCASIRKPTLMRVGSCYCCGEALAPGDLFCDVHCAKQYGREEAARVRNGGRQRS